MFLPGLTADHRLFEKQTEYFENKQNVFVWDAPSHALSRPFTNNYSLSDMAEWLYEILAKEEIYNPIIIGQSMGGYLAQMYMELYPDKIKGFISIDSAPLQKSYMTAMEYGFLKEQSHYIRYIHGKHFLGLVQEGVQRRIMVRILCGR